METTNVVSSNLIREKAIMDSPRDLLPNDVCVNFSWTLPGVSRLVSTDIFGKSSHIRFNLSLAGSLVCMRSWIKQRFLPWSPFRLWCSINVDKALENIILNR